MKESPLFMRGPMVIASLEDRKTQTRRVMKPQPVRLNSAQYEWKDEMANIHGDPAAFWQCPYGQPGDRLWVKETHALNDPIDVSWQNTGVCYAADVDTRRYPTKAQRWRPSIHMPLWASRLTLELTAVRMERVADISEEDALAEGVDANKSINPTAWSGDGGAHWHATAKKAFAALWDSINAASKPVTGKNGIIIHYVSYPWEDVQGTRQHRGKPWLVWGNPRVWTLSYRRVEQGKGWPS